MNWLNRPFDRELFEKYQTQLLYFANSKIGKFYLGIKDPREIVKLTNNSFHIYKGEKQFEATFYGRPIFYRKVKWLMEALRFGVILPFATQGIPILALPVFNPDADPETTSVDGYTTRVGTQEAFGTLRAGAGNGAFPSGTNSQSPSLQAFTTTDIYNELKRVFLLFDSSSLSDTDIIDSASIETAESGGSGTGLGDTTIQVVSSAPATNTNLVTADHAIANFGVTSYANKLVSATVGTNSYYSFNLNASGIANISKTGISKFGLLLGWDFNNSFTGTWVSNAITSLGLIFADNGTNKPRLNVNYTKGAVLLAFI